MLPKKNGKLKKKISKPIKKKKLIKNKDNFKEKDDDKHRMEDEEILSSEESELERKNKDNSNENLEEEEETVDEKRLRLAKKLLQDAKASANIKSDDFFLDAAEEQPFVGVYGEEEEDLVTKTLQNELLKKSGMIYIELAKNLKEKYENQKPLPLILKGHTKCITALRFDPYGKMLYSVSKDSSLIQWDIETNKKTIMSYGKEKDKSGHYDQILALDINFDGRMLVTVGQDQMIKIWDPKTNKVIETLKGHRDVISGVKFQKSSNIFCTVSYDRTFKMWEGGERAYMDTLYGHTSFVNCIDSINNEDFVTCGFDKQAIYWKINSSTQLIFSQYHQYSIDAIRSLTNETFITGSQDARIALWSIKKKKPICEMFDAHGNNNWITSIGNTHNSDIFYSGSYDGLINIYEISEKRNKFNKFMSIESQGIVNDIGVHCSSDSNMIAIAEAEEHRLGRWITKKAKNQIRIIKL